MKKGMIFALCFFWILAGCSNPVKEDLLNYLNNELPKVAEAESIAVEAWGSVSGANYTDNDEMYDALVEDIIPSYRDFLHGVEGITVRLKTKEVRALNEKYIEAATTQNNAFVLLMNMLETEEGSILDFNERLDKARRLIREWQIELQDLCKKNGVPFNPRW
jgi:hypothetical protein